MHLPTEIIEVIMALLGATFNINSMRLVDRRFSQIGAAYLFRVVNITPNTIHVDDTSLTFERFGQYIRVINILPIPHHSVPQEKRLKRDYYSQTLEPVHHHQSGKLYHSKHSDHLLDVYRRFCREKNDTLSIGKLNKFLRQLLKASPSVEEISVSTIPPRSYIKDYELRDTCPQPKCEQRRRYFLKDLIATHRYPNWRELEGRFPMILCALSSAAPIIKSLATETRSLAHVLSERALGSPMDFVYTDKLLSNLTTMRLRLHVELRIKTSRIPTWLSRAINLEKLYLSASVYTPNYYPPYRAQLTSFMAVLDGCHFPKLKVLCLEKFNYASGELHTFLRRCALLEQVVIQDYGRLEGAFSDVLGWIQDPTQLHPIKEILEIGDGLGPDPMDRPTRTDSETIENFWRHGSTFEETAFRWFWRRPERPRYHMLDPVLVETWRRGGKW